MKRFIKSASLSLVACAPLGIATVKDLWLRFALIVIYFISFTFWNFVKVFKSTEQERNDRLDELLKPIHEASGNTIFISILERKGLPWLWEKLEKTYSCPNDRSKPDYHLSFKRLFGVPEGLCWQAFLQGTDLAAKGDGLRDYRLTKRQQAKTERIRGLVVIPFSSGKSARSDTRHVGVVGFHVEDEAAIGVLEEFLNKPSENGGNQLSRIINAVSLEY